MRLHALLACGLLALPASSACSLFAALGAECDDDDGCPAGQVCSEQACVLRCGEGVACPESARCDLSTGRCLGPQADAGPLDPGGVLEVTLAAAPSPVAAGSPVELSWTSSPPATDCALSEKTVFDAAHAPLADAPLGGSGFFTVYPEQDLEYRVTCTKGAATGSATRSVDVTAEGTLQVSPSQIDDDEASELSWTTSGVAACVIEGPASFGYAVPASDTVAGATPLVDPRPGAYHLLCDGAELSSATLDVARVEIASVSPDALGPGDTDVTLAYSYTGPDAASCVVSVDGVPAAEGLDPPAALVTLSDAALLEVQCAGYGGGLVVDSVDVPRLIASFTGPGSPVPHGTSANLEWEASGPCELDGASATSPRLHTFTASATFVLTCTHEGRAATAELLVQVLPAFVGDELVGGVWKADGAEAGVLLAASTTTNAASCAVDGADLVLAEEGEDEKVWHLLVERGASPEAGLAAGPEADGPQTYQVSCRSDAAEEVLSDELVTAWWGDLAAGSFGAFAASGATLVTKRVEVTGASPPTEGLASLREVGAHLVVLGTSELQDLVGLEQLTRILGRLEVLDNADLRRTVDLGTGLLALRSVGAGIEIGDALKPNPALIDASLPALEEVTGPLLVSSNAALTTLSMPALSSVSGAVHVADNRPENLFALTIVDFRSLASVGAEGGGFTLLHTLVPAFSGVVGQGYRPFGSLVSVGTGNADDRFEVRHNPAMPCAEVLDTYCGLSPRPGDYSENNNDGTCAQVCP